MSISELNKRLTFIKSEPLPLHKKLMEHLNDLKFWTWAKTLKT